MKSEHISKIVCANDESCPKGRPVLPVPPEWLDSTGHILREFRNQDHEGFYVSPEGHAYCCRACWAEYCD